LIPIALAAVAVVVKSVVVTLSLIAVVIALPVKIVVVRAGVVVLGCKYCHLVSSASPTRSPVRFHFTNQTNVADMPF